MTYRFSLLTPDMPTALRRLHRELDRQTSSVFPTEETGANAWLPATDVLEGAEGWTLQLDVPGVDPAALEVVADERTLIVRGERAAAVAETPATAAPSADEAATTPRVRRERATGRFERRFRLPATADTEQLAATLTHGVLTLRVPKVAPARPRRIAVETPVQATPNATTAA